ncbi:hypothetical protein GCM10027340_29160 [Marinomonas epiphytica]
MSEMKTNQIEKLNKLRTAWLPVVEFLFGPSPDNVSFAGFDVSNEIAKPVVTVTKQEQQLTYQIQIPERSFTNEVMLLCDVVQELVRGLYPLEDQAFEPNVLSEGVAVYGAVTAINQVFGEETLATYINALEQRGFSYYDAFNYAADVLATDPEAIKKLRNVQPFLYKLQKSDFDTAQVLVERKIQDILLFTFRE